jgi:hypothetical protein
MYPSVQRRFGRYRRRVERLVCRNGFVRAQLVRSYFSTRLRKPGLRSAIGEVLAIAPEQEEVSNEEAPFSGGYPGPA